MVAETIASRKARTYGNWRKPTSSGILGLGAVGTVILFLGSIFVILVMMTQGLLQAFFVALGVGVVLLMLMLKDQHGRNALSRISNRVGWWSARSQGTNVYRSGPVGQAPWGTNQLPGLAAPMRLSEHHDSYNRPFALLFTPRGSSYSVVISTEPDGASLVDQEQVDVWVADFGHMLANLADEPGLEAASVTIETAPDSGARLRREVEANLDPNAPAFSRAMMLSVVENYPAGSSTVKAYVSFTFSAYTRVGGKRRKPDEMARELASRLPGLTAMLEATGAGAAHPMTAQALCEYVRVAYDPKAATLIDSAHAEGQVPEMSWLDVGPSAAEAQWSSYRHDSGLSVTWSMTEAPRGNVQSGVLARLLSPHRDIARKRVTFLYRPVSAARAAAMVEADLNSASFRATSNKKAKARDSRAVRAAEATANEEASGAGLVNFGILVTATVTDTERMPDAAAAIDNLGATARLRLRPVYGSQDSAFVGALPLGLVLPKHISIPAELRNNL